MKSVLFIVFSIIEAFSFFTLMLTVFRFNVLEYTRSLIPISVLMAFASFAIWLELDLSSYAPIISVVIFTIFLYLVLKTSLFGALIVSIAGYIAAFIIQTATLILLTSTGFITLDRVQETKPDAFILMGTSSALIFLLSIFLYKKGYGTSTKLTTKINNIRWAGEDKFILLLIIIGIVLVCIIPLLATKLYLAELAYLLVFLFFFYLFIRKARR